MQEYSVRVEPSPVDRDIRYVEEQVRAFEASLLPPDNQRDIVSFLRDIDGNVVGGLIGQTRYRTCTILRLWVDQGLRRQGYGSKLLACVEDKARSMDCRIAMVGTYESFGARPFYERHGYTVALSMRDSPRGQIGYFLHKDLA